VNRPTLGEAFGVWAKIGLSSFGGPAGQIALMHKELVERRKWLDERRFLHALSFCMLLPGPEAQQLAIYVGWLLHRTLGGIIAGVLFVLPGFFAVLGLSALYAVYGRVPIVAALFFGLKAAVLAIVIEAVIRVGKRALTSRALVAIAAAAFVSIFFLRAPFPLVIAGAGACGFLAPSLFPRPVETGEERAAETVVGAMDRAGELAHTKPSAMRAAVVVLVGAIVWIGPLLAVAAVLGKDSVVATEGFFFAKVAVVTFGGAYAVLAYVAQQAVEAYAWLGAREMIDGLGLAETTPGPLILVVDFVGFLAAFRHPGALSPLAAGVAGAAVSAWATFAPCFVWVFGGAPYVESLRGHRALGAALSAITAAVVGVILNLSIWFALHAVFREIDERHVSIVRVFVPHWRTLDVAAAVLAAGAMIAMLRFGTRVLPTLGVCALAGAACQLLT
jgi:chromate transporter